ncbi:DUF6463 family protein [Massilia glaciei]|uniref:Molecular chaperone GroEL n=1 Tax=Massilia glaciei TaxID=1524097 RepID=A0A2U2HLK9_9BURK|nr:DUF6463 family protein [Massilia glaciei]PWF48408.1 hypothetical protein C7C56_011855 [Massilia glaciei]
MKNKKIWIGRWIIFVAAGHSLLGLAVFSKVLVRMFERGVFNSVGADPGANLATWFLMFGAVLALLGMALNALERHQDFPAARSLGVGILLMTIAGVVLVPVSGFWLALPAAIALVWQRKAPVAAAMA